jgi:cell division septum initiation protein DivIVA
VEDQTSLLQGTLQEDSFEVVMRGYNKRQVDDYVLQCQHHIRDLAQRLALAEQEVERVRVDAAEALEKAAAKPVHEEVSERLGQILRLASEEAERERAAAAEEIAALRAQTLAETQALREQAQAQSDDLRQQVTEEAEGVREQAKAETDALRERVSGEADAMRQRAEQEAAHQLEQARLEAERVLTEARDAAERDVAQAHTQSRDVEEKARTESERLMLAAQERAESVIGDAERRATAVNSVLGTRLELLTSTHSDVMSRLLDLRTVLLDVLDKEGTAGPFAVVPSPAEAAALTVATARGALTVPNDPYVQTAGEVAAAYEASPEAAVTSWGEAPASRQRPGQDEVLDVDAVAHGAVAHGEVGEVVPAAPAGPATGVGAGARRLDLGAAEKTRR